MYAKPSLSSSARPCTSSFSRAKWFGENFGLGKKVVPNWGVPSSILPFHVQRKQRQPGPGTVDASNELLQEVEQDPFWHDSSTDQRRAYLYFRTKSSKMPPVEIDMADFLELVEIRRGGESTGVEFYDCLLDEILRRYPSIGNRKPEQNPPANHIFSADRFSIPISHDTFTPTSAKSRSQENINTNFSPNGWSGKFAGSNDYFAPEPTARRRSPARRTGSRRGLYTPDSGSASESMPPPPPPDSTRPTNVTAPPPPPDSTRPASLNGKFSEEEWKSTFKDASWTWPPPPSTAPPTDSKIGLRSKTGSRKNGKLSSKSSHLSSASNTSNHATTGTRETPLVVDDDDPLPETEPDAMDIDTPPPGARPVSNPAEQPTPTSSTKEARVYSVPISEWRQQQEEAQQGIPNAKRQARAPSTTEAKLKTNLEDLANVEPIGRSAAEGGGLKNLADLSETLPFPSQPSSIGGSAKETSSQALQIPALPKVPLPPAKWTKSSWSDYAARFAAYLQHHHQFNRGVLKYFEAREKVSEELMGVQGWLESSGGSFEQYVVGVEGDEGMREIWGLEGERHREAVRGFERGREQVRRIVLGGGLVD